jgi:hypothetical protein
MKSKARVSNTEYDAAWKEWLTAVDKYLTSNEIGKGGPIILNQIGKQVCQVYISLLRICMITDMI